MSEYQHLLHQNRAAKFKCESTIQHRYAGINTNTSDAP